MSANQQKPEVKRPLTDVDRKLAFSFLQYFKTVFENTDDISMMSAALGGLFDIDTTGVGGSNDANIDLHAVFKNAVAASLEGDDKFKAFVALLQTKGYFKDVVEGTPEYTERLEKARAKFDQRNNPFAGMTSEELKVKGNALMKEQKYKEAIAHYTKAIELDKSNHILYANRAAAHLHTNDYNSAIVDCETSLSINSKYAKAYARLGTAYYYLEKFRLSVDAYENANRLEPGVYEDDLKAAKDKAAAAGVTTTGGGGMPGFPGMGGGGGFPGLPPGMDFSAAMEMMKDPKYQEMMQTMMSNPEMRKAAMEMTQSMMGGNFNPAAAFDPAKAAELRQNFESKMDPEKLRRIREDVQANGIEAFQKYADDAEVMQMSQEMMKQMYGGGGAPQ